MGVKIGNYEGVTSTPNALIQAGNNPVARPVDPTTAVGVGLQALGKGLGDVADAFTHKDNADAIARSSLVASNFAQEAYDYQTKLKEELGPKGENFAGKFREWYDARSKELIAAEPNMKGQAYLQQNFMSHRTTMGLQALHYEAQAGISHRDTEIEQSYQNYARMVQEGKMSYTDAQKQMDITIANMGYDPVTRADRAKSYRERLTENFLTGRIKRDPEGTKSLLQASYSGGFNGAVGFVFKHEGGLNPADTNGTASNMGINQKAHPEVDVTKLTKQGAAEIYKRDYWDKIGGDALSAKNPQLALMAFDTAVVAGVGKAQSLLDKAGGDPSKFMELRESFLNGLIAKDPEKYAKYQKAWSLRNADLRTASIGNLASDSDAQAAMRNINIDRVPTFINQAQSEADKQQATYQAELQTRVANQTALLMNGESVQNPPSESDFIRAYGETDGRKKFSEFLQVSQLGGDIASLKTMPVAKQQELLAARKPDPNSATYADDVLRYNKLEAAANAVNQQIHSDPMGYAQNAKIGDVQPINWNDAATTGNELRKRVGIAQTLNRDYAAPLAVLTQREAQNLSAGLQNLTPREKLNYLGTIQANVTDPEAYRAIMQQIAPDSPVTAMAGMILNKSNPSVQTHWFSSNDVFTQSDVAAKLLKGEALLNPNKAAKGEDGKSRGFQMPKEVDMRSQFANSMGKAFADHPQAADIAFQAVKAYYAAASSEAGDLSGNLDSTRFDKAIAAVTGKPTNVNGNGEVIRPWGMDESTFNNALKQKFTQAMKENGLSGTQVDNWGLYGVQPVGDGLYAVRMGTGFLPGKNGQRIVLDLTTPPSKVSLIPLGDGLAQATPAPAITQRPEKAQPMTTTSGKIK